MMLFHKALTRPPTRSLVKCVSSNPLRSTVDPSRALEQYRAYVKTLIDLGVDVVEMKPLEDHSDSVFIQDTGVAGASTRRALISRMGVESRRGEERDVEDYLRREGFETIRLKAPGTLEGGDVLVTGGGIVYVGLSGRTNAIGVGRLAEAFPEKSIVGVRVSGVLHLLSAVKSIGPDVYIYMPGHVDTGVFGEARLIEAPRDPMGLNFMYLGDDVAMLASGSPRLRELLRRLGVRPVEVDVSEFWKCDGSMTCLSFPLYTSL